MDIGFPAVEKDIVEESESKVDLSGNWLSIPEFGNYKEIQIEQRIDLLM